MVSIREEIELKTGVKIIMMMMKYFIINISQISMLILIIT